MGHLFCNACREILSVKRSTVLNHVKSSKHEASKEKLKKKESREINIATALTKHDKSAQGASWQTLSSEQRVYYAPIIIIYKTLLFMFMIGHNR